MRSRFNMFPIVEGKETKANTIGKAAIIGGCILTFGMHLFYKENGARIWTVSVGLNQPLRVGLI